MNLTVLPFTAQDGENLALYEWRRETGSDPSAATTRPRGIVLIVHGLGEHAGRYGHVAHRLLGWGFIVRGYDQRGHGRSTGAPGAVPSNVALLDDLAEIIDETRLHGAPFPTTAGGLEAVDAKAKVLPLILLGHSMGGLLAARFVALKIRPVEALVMSSPALDAGVGMFRKLLLALMLRLAPDRCVNNGLDARYISRAKSVVEDYQADRLVHSKISPRLARFIESSGPLMIAAAAQWSTPTLLMYAGADRLVRADGSRRFAAAASSMVTAKCFDAMYHEIFNAAESATVFNILKVWLDTHFPQ